MLLNSMPPTGSGVGRAVVNELFHRDFGSKDHRADPSPVSKFNAPRERLTSRPYVSWLIVPSRTKTITARALSCVLGSTSILGLGCRTSRVAGPPLFEVQGPVHDLAAIRAENHVWISWTMPQKGTNKLMYKGVITVRVWRGEGRVELTEVGDPLPLTAGATGSFSEELPLALSSGRPRLLYYYVELLDRKARSTGLSNYVATVAGGPPPVVEDLSAEMTQAGVLLRWKSSDGAATAIRIHRTMFFETPEDERKAQSTPPAPLEVDLFREDARSAQTLDKTVRYGNNYEYRAQFVAQVPVSNRVVLELAGPFSAPADIEAEKIP